MLRHFFKEHLVARREVPYCFVRVLSLFEAGFDGVHAEVDLF